MKTRRVKEQKGITLIALVITIIVLLILAGVAISMLSGENGILKQAANAKTQTEKKSEEEAVKLAATAAMTNANHQVEESVLVSELNSQLGAGNYSKNPTEDGWEIIVTKTGNHYAVGTNGEAKHLAWYYTEDGKQITNGKQTLTLGDTVNYNPIEGLTADADGVYKKYKSKVERNGYVSQTFSIKNNDAQKLTWKVLGTDADGNVLIMPTECIKDAGGTIQYLTLGTDYSGGGTSVDDLQEGQVAAQYGAEEVNNVAEIYGHGEGAKVARSVTEEDIGKIVKPTSSTSISAYGNKVTYTLNKDDGYVYYDWTGATKHPTKGDYEIFKYLEGNTWKKLQPGQSVTLTSTYKSYPSLRETNCKNTNLYNLLTKDTDTNNGQYYWLGSSYVFTNSGYAGFGVRLVLGYGVGNCDFFCSYGIAGDRRYGVRPAVSLESDIIFGGDATSGWTIQ